MGLDILLPHPDLVASGDGGAAAHRAKVLGLVARAEAAEAEAFAARSQLARFRAELAAARVAAGGREPFRRRLVYFV
jgi:hypothetical protein